jgi:tight adherence protein C
MSGAGTQLLFQGAVAAIAAAITIAVYRLGLTPPAPLPRLGRRGLKRHHALARSPRFAAFEPTMRFVAGLVAWLPLGGARRRADARIGAAGDYLGLTPDEYFALSVLGGAAGLAAGWVLGGGDDTFLMVAGVTVGVILPRHRIASEATRRRREIARGLPPAIDLAALCLSAGMDFPGAIRQVTDAAAVHDALHEELRTILQELELGHTRRSALEGFAGRVDSEEVRDFVAAVVQAEQRGNPLGEVLRIQAEVLRQRRTVRGEEAAARASVLMIGPLVMLILSVLCLILGPLLLRSVAAFTGGG